MNRTNPIARALIAIFLLVLPAVISHAQAPRYTPPPPPDKGIALEVRMRYLLPPSINFTGFGNIPANENFRTETDLILGTTRAIEYDDGYLRQDYIETVLVEGSGQTQLLPSPNQEATSNFAYLNADQVDANDPSTLIFHRYSAAAGDPDAELKADSDNSLGWEINYTKYLRGIKNLGVQVGFSFNGFDSRYNESITADLYVQEYRHQMAGGVDVPDLPEPTDEGQPPYIGDAVREEVATGDLLEWAESDMSEEMIAGGATVDTLADFRSSLYNFRAGPTYTVSVGQKFGLQLGAGVNALYYSGQFSAYEALNNPSGGLQPSRSLITTNSNEWQVGGYLDASAYFQFTDRINLFSGMQVQSGSTYSQANENRHASVDFSSQVYIHAGVGLRF